MGAREGRGVLSGEDQSAVVMVAQVVALPPFRAG